MPSERPAVIGVSTKTDRQVFTGRKSATYLYHSNCLDADWSCIRDKLMTEVNEDEKTIGSEAEVRGPDHGRRKA